MPVRTRNNSYWETFNAVAVLDPSVASRNAGDEIISDAARTEIAALLPDHFQAVLPTHERMGTRSWRLIKQSEHVILAGSNILTTKMLLDRGWRYSPIDTIFVKGIISLATGWRSYRKERAPVGKAILSRALSKNGLHSVRDEFSRTRLIEAGFKNVVNTACVTMWRLDLEALKGLPLAKAPGVVTTVNAGQAGPEDRELAKLLLDSYEEVFVWPQGIDDGAYVSELFGDRATIIGPTLRAYDALLSSPRELDFVGLRLHGGIRAMQHGRRALIVAVDNRAAEIARDTNLPVIERSELRSLEDRIRNPQPIDIRLPWSEIEAWRAQFRG